MTDCHRDLCQDPHEHILASLLFHLFLCTHLSSNPGQQTQALQSSYLTCLQPSLPWAITRRNLLLSSFSHFGPLTPHSTTNDISSKLRNAATGLDSTSSHSTINCFCHSRNTETKNLLKISYGCVVPSEMVNAAEKGASSPVAVK